MYKEKLNNPLAYPCDNTYYEGYTGMTLLDYFAAKAMQSLIEYESDLPKTREEIAEII